MTNHIVQIGEKPSSDASIGSKIEVIDAGVPTARAMSELLAMLPPGIRLDPFVCLNPFDQRCLQEMDSCQRVADTAHANTCSSSH